MWNNQYAKTKRQRSTFQGRTRDKESDISEEKTKNSKSQQRIIQEKAEEESNKKGEETPGKTTQTVSINNGPTTSTIRMYKEQWIDKLQYKRIKLQKMIERGKKIRDNATFERDQKSFFRKIESSHEGQIPEIEKFVEFWGGIWEKEERTPEMPWMEKCEKI